MRDNDCNTFHGRNDVALIKQALEFIETLGFVWKPTLCNLDCVAVWWFRKWSPPVWKIITCCTVDQQLFPLKTTSTKDIGEVAQLTPSCLWRTRATWDANRLKNILSSFQALITALRQSFVTSFPCSRCDWCDIFSSKPYFTSSPSPYLPADQSTVSLDATAALQRDHEIEEKPSHQKIIYKMIFWKY